MRRNLRIRNRALIFLLLPIALVFWMVGWVLYLKGSQDGEQTERTAAKDDGVEISVGMVEEEAECHK